MASPDAAREESRPKFQKSSKRISLRCPSPLTSACRCRTVSTISGRRTPDAGANASGSRRSSRAVRRTDSLPVSDRPNEGGCHRRSAPPARATADVPWPSRPPSRHASIGGAPASPRRPGDSARARPSAGGAAENFYDVRRERCRSGVLVVRGRGRAIFHMQACRKSASV